MGLIAATETRTGLNVYAQLDQRSCERGVEVTDDHLAAVNITRQAFPADWNYTINPSSLGREPQSDRREPGRSRW